MRMPGPKRARRRIHLPGWAPPGGTRPLELQRLDDRTIELYTPRSWVVTALDHISARFRAGTRITLPAFRVEVREVDANGAPTRARFTFDRSLDDPGLSFWLWKRSHLTRYTLPPTGTQLQLPASSTL